MQQHQVACQVARKVTRHMTRQVTYQVTHQMTCQVAHQVASQNSTFSNLSRKNFQKYNFPGGSDSHHLFTDIKECSLPASIESLLLSAGRGESDLFPFLEFFLGIFG